MPAERTKQALYQTVTRKIPKLKHSSVNPINHQAEREYALVQYFKWNESVHSLNYLTYTLK